MSQKLFNYVIGNPPYMGSGGMNGALSEYVKKQYSDEKSDLYACFNRSSRYLILSTFAESDIVGHAKS